MNSYFESTGNTTNLTMGRGYVSIGGKYVNNTNLGKLYALDLVSIVLLQPYSQQQAPLLHNAICVDGVTSSNIPLSIFWRNFNVEALIFAIGLWHWLNAVSTSVGASRGPPTRKCFRVRAHLFSLQNSGRTNKASTII